MSQVLTSDGARKDDDAKETAEEADTVAGQLNNNVNNSIVQLLLPWSQ